MVADFFWLSHPLAGSSGDTLTDSAENKSCWHLGNILTCRCRRQERHAEARERLAQGVDPSLLKQAQKTAGKEQAANSFEFVAREWFATWKTDKAESHYGKVIARLEKDVFPYIGSKPIAEIKAPDILSVLRRIESRNIVDTAHKAKYSISQVLRYAVVSGRAEHDPCPDLRGALKPIKESHYPALTEPDKVAELLRTIDGYKGGPIVRAALRLAPLVFVRPGELRAAKWTDIDLDRAEWNTLFQRRKRNILFHWRVRRLKFSKTCIH